MLERGHVVETGSHEALVEARGYTTPVAASRRARAATPPIRCQERRVWRFDVPHQVEREEMKIMSEEKYVFTASRLTHGNFWFPVRIRDHPRAGWPASNRA